MKENLISLLNCMSQKLRRNKMGPDKDKELNLEQFEEDQFEEKERVIEKQEDLEKASYNLPEDEEIFVDEQDGSIKLDKDLSPFEKIQVVAKKNKVKINDPKKNCKHCYGRGYIGFDINKENYPVPCTCIYPSETRQQKPSLAPNYKSKRKMMLLQKRFTRRIKRAAHREAFDGWELKPEGKKERHAKKEA